MASKKLIDTLNYYTDKTIKSFEVDVPDGSHTEWLTIHFTDGDFLELISDANAIGALAPLFDVHEEKKDEVV